MKPNPSVPTIEARLQKRQILMTTDASMIAAVEKLLPADWQLTIVTDLEQIGDWNDVLLYRFLLMDLNEVDAFDPIDVIRQIRMQFQINIPVFCFGGDADVQDEMRLARADRFFSREEMLQMLPTFYQQYEW
ncbi:MAG: hypothetical protein OEW58_06135 [Gammaproteobacteria bacterium]|nr:hypothetical protein [Gammaproteobacteria bacterium]